MPAVLARTLAVVVLVLLASACGSRRSAPSVDGAYRATVSATAEGGGTWTLVLERHRFAFTHEAGRACDWAYGALTVKGQRMDWRIIDAGGTPTATANQPADRYGFTWSRYRDLLTLGAVSDAPAGPFAARPWRRLSATPSAARLSRRCPALDAALSPTGVEDVRPSLGVKLGFSGDLTRTSATTWQGKGTSRQLGPGTMTITGHVAFGPLTRGRLTFSLSFAGGQLHGCAVTTIVRRPHARYVWDGPGQITGASRGLSRYLALAGGIGGVTMTDDLDHMHGGFGTHAGRSGQPDAIC